MNERFKFRAWDINNQEYIENIQNCNCSVISGMCIDCFEDYLISDDYIVEQCTGIKDKNGKLIYENDILKWNNLPYGNIVVKWDIDNFISMVGLSPVDKNTEIIGNIHQNKELLKG